MIKIKMERYIRIVNMKRKFVFCDLKGQQCYKKSLLDKNCSCSIINYINNLLFWYMKKKMVLFLAMFAFVGSIYTVAFAKTEL